MSSVDDSTQTVGVNWVLLAKEPEEPQAKCLQDYLIEKGYPNQLTCIASNEIEKFIDTVEMLKPDYDQIRIGPPYESILGEYLELTPSLTMSLRTADCIVKQEGKWWPRSTLNEAMTRIMAKEIKKIDFKAKVLVIGVGAKARAVVLALLNAGFKDINFVSRSLDKSEKLVQDLKRNYFGVKFDFYAEEEITYLPGVHSLLVNTTPNIPENSLLDDFYFYNYLAKNSFIIDLSREKLKSSLVQQAEEMGIQCVSGNLVLAYKDCIWTESVFDFSFPVEEYYNFLLTKLFTGDNSENDSAADLSPAAE